MNLAQVMTDGMLVIPKVLLKKYVQLGLNEEQFMVLIHIYRFIEEGNQFPTPKEISEVMSIDEGKCMEVIRSLIKSNCIQLEQFQDITGVVCEKYSFTSLWEELERSESIEKMEEETSHEISPESVATIYQIFEQEFGRLLSPMEYETIQLWLDQDKLDIQIIKAALKEAVINGKLNFRYIDRILFEWSKNGVRTIEDAKAYSSRFRGQSKNTQANKSRQVESDQVKKIEFYNWLQE